MTTHVKRTRSAITLIEITLGLALAAIVVFIGIRTYWTSQDNQRAQALEQELGTVKSIIDARFGPIGDYSLVTSDLIATALPKSEGTATSAGYMTTAINNPFKGGVYLSGDTSSYTIEADLISAASCGRILKFFNDQKDLSTVTLWDTASGAQIDYIDIVNEGLPTADRLGADCSSASLQTADIQFVFGAAGQGGGSSGGGGTTGGPGSGNGQLTACSGESNNCWNGIDTTSMNQKQLFVAGNYGAFENLYQAGFLPGVAIPQMDWDIGQYRNPDGSIATGMTGFDYDTVFLNTIGAYCTANDCMAIAANAQQQQQAGLQPNYYNFQVLQ